LSEELLERIYTINLGKVLLSPNNQRAKRAINMIREFASRHMKSENVKIEEDVSHLVWERGIRHPPRKIRVKLTKDDDGNILVSKYQELSPNNQRAKRAINMIREFASRHMKSENVKIEEDVSHLVWERGIRHPPRKIRVKLTKDDDGNILVSKYQEEKKVEEKPKEKKGEKKVEEKPKEKKEEKKASASKSDEKQKKE